MTGTVLQDGDAMGQANILCAINGALGRDWLDGTDYEYTDDPYHCIRCLLYTSYKYVCCQQNICASSQIALEWRRERVRFGGRRKRILAAQKEKPAVQA